MNPKQVSYVCYIESIFIEDHYWGKTCLPIKLNISNMKEKQPLASTTELHPPYLLDLKGEPL